MCWGLAGSRFLAIPLQSTIQTEYSGTRPGLGGDVDGERRQQPALDVPWRFPNETKAEQGEFVVGGHARWSSGFCG